MKIPPHIKKAIREKAKASAIARSNDAIIRNWFQENNMQNDGVFDMYIDCTDIGNDPEAFIDFIENDQFEYGNEFEYDED